MRLKKPKQFELAILELRRAMRVELAKFQDCSCNHCIESFANYKKMIAHIDQSLELIS